jgi:hypothetical protein
VLRDKRPEAQPGDNPLEVALVLSEGTRPLQLCGDVMRTAMRGVGELGARYIDRTLLALDCYVFPGRGVSVALQQLGQLLDC